MSKENGTFGKFVRDPGTRFILSIIGVIFIAGTIYATRNTDVEQNSDDIEMVQGELIDHEEDEDAHMDVDEMKEVAISDFLINQNKLDIRRLQNDHAKDMEAFLKIVEKGNAAVIAVINAKHGN